MIQPGDLVYIAGPMSKYADTDHNVPVFNNTANRWRDAGYKVINPAEEQPGLPYEAYMLHAIQQLGREDLKALVVLPDWQQSAGATFEVKAALMRGLPVLDASKPPKEFR